MISSYNCKVKEFHLNMYVTFFFNFKYFQVERNLLIPRNAFERHSCLRIINMSYSLQKNISFKTTVSVKQQLSFFSLSFFPQKDFQILQIYKILLMVNFLLYQIEIFSIYKKKIFIFDTTAEIIYF